jgi:hypothetical protein
MRLALSSWRRRATLLAVAGVAAVTAVVAGVALGAGPAAATWQTLSGDTTCDCIVKDTETNRYRAVFGYTNTGRQAGKIAIGDNNRLVATGPNAPAPNKVDGVQTTTFETGTHKAAFATAWLSKDVQITWKVGGKSSSASWNKPVCGRDVSLPADGNGSGPVIVLFASLLIAGGAVLLRRRRLAPRAA